MGSWLTLEGCRCSVSPLCGILAGLSDSCSPEQPVLVTLLPRASGWGLCGKLEIPRGLVPSVLSHGKVQVAFSCITAHRSGLHSGLQRNVQGRLRPDFVSLGSIAVELPG